MTEEFVIDFSDVEDLGPVPDGVYYAEVTKATPGKAQSGYGKINLQWQLLEGEYEGRIVFDTLSFHPNAMAFTKKKLLDLGFDAGFSGTVEPEALLGVSRNITVVVKTSTNIDPETSEPYPPQNRITKISA